VIGLTEHLIANRPGFTTDSADRLVRAMNVTFPLSQHDAGAADLDRLSAFDLPDEDDRHVIAAALAANAPFICTHNTKDFPRHVLIGLGLAVVAPDDLLCWLIRDHEAAMRWAHHSAVHSLPGATGESTLRALRNAGAPRAASLMAQLLQRNG
jgi:hypothetical protein